MKRRLQRILAVLTVLAMAIGCVPLAAVAEGAQEIRIICAEWNDENNYDGKRPASVEVSFGEGATVTLNAENSWTGEVLAPAGAKASAPAVEGYGAPVVNQDGTVVTYTRQIPKISVSGNVVWEDHDNAAGIRPASIQLRLLADGEPYGASRAVAGAGSATWDNVPMYRPGGTEPVNYTLDADAPEGYSLTPNGLTVIASILTGGLTLKASVSAPEGADVSGLKLTVTGPDPKMPVTLTMGQISGGTYDFGQVLPGAYVVQETNGDTLLEGYEMDPFASHVGDAVSVKPGVPGELNFRYAYREPGAAEPAEDPLENAGALSIVIDGPDPRMPMTVTYGQFTDGKYELDGLVPGSYSVVERNAETLVRAYTLTSDSVTGMSITVGKEGATATLFNQYTPALTPEPEPELIDIPVTKTWNDDNNKDGNRPQQITVRLYADGTEVDNITMSAASGWTGVFLAKPRAYEDGTEIVYTVNEDPVEWYTASVNGTNITNTYQPEVTSVSARKVWNDDDNAQKLRPTTLAVILQPVGTVYVLSAENGWAVTADNLPTRINGEAVTYSWTEQETLGYVRESVTVDGNVTTFTNRITRIPPPPAGNKVPRAPRGDIAIFEEYQTALGVEVMINHVGDCFD